MDIVLREVADPKKNLAKNQKDDKKIARVRRPTSKVASKNLDTMNRRKNLKRKSSTPDSDTTVENHQGAAPVIVKKRLSAAETMEKIICKIAGELECEVEKFDGGVIFKNDYIFAQVHFDDDDFQQCYTGYFNDPKVAATESLQMLRDGEFAKFRDSVGKMAARISKSFTPDEYTIAYEAWRCIEYQLAKHASDCSFAAINNSQYGLYIPHTDLTVGKLYFFLEQNYIAKSGKNGRPARTRAVDEDLPFMSYCELGFENCEMECVYPEYNPDGVWSNYRPANVCLRVAFPTGMLISNETMKKMDLLCMMAKPPNVRSSANFYQSLADVTQAENLCQILTNFQDNEPDHLYNMSWSCFSEDDDFIVNAIYLKDLRLLPSLITILRSEMLHASHWKSMTQVVQTIHKKIKFAVSPLFFKTKLTRDQMAFEVNLTKDTTEKIKLRIMENEDGLPIARCHFTSVGLEFPHFNNTLTQKLRESSSVPAILKLAIEYSRDQLEAKAFPVGEISYKHGKRPYSYKNRKRP